MFKAAAQHCPQAFAVPTLRHREALTCDPPAPGEQSPPLPSSGEVSFGGSDLSPGKQDKEERGLRNHWYLWGRLNLFINSRKHFPTLGERAKSVEKAV